MITLITATDEKGLIGSGDTVPWHLPGELAFFRRTTMGGVVIMGRRTWQALPGARPFLDGRINFVVTRKPEHWKRRGDPETEEGPRFVDSIETAVREARERFPRQAENMFVAGGRQLYQAAIESGIVERMIVSRVEGAYAGDVYFPGVPRDWVGTHVFDGEGFSVTAYVPP